VHSKLRSWPSYILAWLVRRFSSTRRGPKPSSCAPN